VAVHLDASVDHVDVTLVGAEDRVVLQQVRHEVDREQVVGGDEVEVRPAFLGGAEEVPADASETVDADLRGHEVLLGSWPAAWATPILATASSRDRDGWPRRTRVLQRSL